MSSEWIDLRSDTVTKPTSGMRQAIATAEVGDDIYGEDPTVNRLEERVAALLGKEAAVYNCSGTQSNQMALRAHCRPGDEILIDETGHIVNYECGAASALSGIAPKTVKGIGGIFDVADLEGKIRPDNQHFSVTRLVCIENTTNHGGGRIWPLEQMKRVSEWSHAHGLQVHLDGARLFNASIAAGYSVTEFSRNADSVSICFSKGLGCPMGSILVGSASLIHSARRARKQFGGALRQAGMMAAAALYALEHHVDRLKTDHQNAALFAQLVAKIRGIRLNPDNVESNLVFFEIEPQYGSAIQLSEELTKRRIRINPSGSHRLRACTHLDINEADIRTAVEAIEDCLKCGMSPIKHPESNPYRAK